MFEMKRAKLFYLRCKWKAKHAARVLRTEVPGGFWYVAGLVLWDFSAWHREGYYAYREATYKAYRQPLVFYKWLESGGWKLK